MQAGVSCVLGRRVVPADELRAKVSQVCASRYGLAVGLVCLGDSTSRRRGWESRGARAGRL